MKLVADENIPHLEAFFGRFGLVEALNGRRIDPSALRGAHALLCRSVTRVDKNLLEGTGVRFVGTTTAGVDHIDTDYLTRAGIAFAAAPGSNAASVADYVVSVMLELSAITASTLRGKRLGIVGVGAVGSALARRAPGLGLEVLLHDPPLLERQPAAAGDAPFVALEEIIREADVVSLHVPLADGGRHPTFHLFGGHNLGRLKPGAWLINTARGAVIDNAALVELLSYRSDVECVLDVWEGEPTPRHDLMAAVRFGTPHVAGYAFDGKVAGARAVAVALAGFVGDPRPIAVPDAPPRVVPLPASCTTSGNEAAVAAEWTEGACLLHAARGLYDFREDFARFAVLKRLEGEELAQAFVALRRDYPDRRGFEHCEIHCRETPAPGLQRTLEEALGARVVFAPQTS